MINVEKNKALLKALHNSKSTSPIIPKDVIAPVIATASKPATAKPAKDKAKKGSKATAKPETAKREVVAFVIKPVDEQSRYEQRYYMRDFHKDEQATVVRHKTSHGIASASEACLAFMQAQADKTKKRTFRTHDLIQAIDSFGPSYGDCIRNSMRKLKAAGLVQIHRVEDGSRSKYEFELLKEKPAVTKVK